MLKIVSLLPSATEVVASLGLAEYLVGRSHECDYPPEVQKLPACTQPKFNPEGSSGEIHDRVTELLQTALSVYRIETDILQQLQPTHIVTQAQCDVCAVSLADVEKAAATLLGCQPQVISLQPNLLAEVWTDMERVASALGVDGSGAIASLKSRVEAVAKKTQSLPEAQLPTVACIEWIQPLMAAGNWIPELVSLAGGRSPSVSYGESLFGIPGQHSPWLQWQDLVAADPDIIICMPCGFDLAKTREDALQLTQYPEWSDLSAVRGDRVYITDGNSYFNRPGPRLVDSLEILAEILHPDLFPISYLGSGWEVI